MAQILDYYYFITKKKKVRISFLNVVMSKNRTILHNTATAPVATNESHFQYRFVAVFAFVIQSLSQKSVISCCLLRRKVKT